MGDIEDAMAASRKQAGARFRRQEAMASEGRARVAEFVELMRRHGVAPIPVLSYQRVIETTSAGGGPLRMKRLRKDLQRYALLGQGWILDRTVYEWSDYADVIIPGIGLVRADFGPWPTPRQSTRSVSESQWEDEPRGKYKRHYVLSVVESPKPRDTGHAGTAKVPIVQIGRTVIFRGRVAQESGPERGRISDDDEAYVSWAGPSAAEKLAMQAQALIDNI